MRANRPPHDQLAHHFLRLDQLLGAGVHVSGSGLESFSLRGALRPRFEISEGNFELSFQGAAGETASSVPPP